MLPKGLHVHKIRGADYSHYSMNTAKTRSKSFYRLIDKTFYDFGFASVSALPFDRKARKSVLQGIGRALIITEEVDFYVCMPVSSSGS